VRYASVVVLLLLVAWGARSEHPVPAPVSTPSRPQILLGTTVEVIESGLLDALLPYFEQSTGYHVTVVDADRNGASTQPDAILLSTEALSGVKDRQPVMSASYMIVGPSSDRAHVRGKAALDALRAVASTGATWVSRRDGLDTNRLELDMWQAALGRDAQHEGWYVSTYKGMPDTLAEANRRQAYTLTDTATFLAERNSLNLEILAQGDPLLKVEYSIAQESPEQNPSANSEGAKSLAKFLVSPNTQRFIAQYGAAGYVQKMYGPVANGEAEK
jgi:tungstate transport system substrate-binding protein